MYHVVFEYTEGEFAGNRYRCQWPSEEEFNKREKEGSYLKVVTQGVSDEESLRLCEEVPVLTLVMGAVAESRDAEGRLDFQYLEMELGNVECVLRDRQRAR